MEPLLGTFNNHPMTRPEFRELPARPRQPQERASRRVEDEEFEPSKGLATVHPFAYLESLRSLLEQGRIREAQNLYEFAKDFVPPDSKIRKALEPPRVRTIARRDANRRAEFRWLSKNSDRFRGKWVALSGESLVASADTLKELLATMQSSRIEGDPILHHLD